MDFDLKKFLKSFKTNESSISMALGALVIVIVGILVVNYFKDKNAQTIPGINTQANSKEHVVVKGESLWSIAEDYFGSGYNWTDIAGENKLKNYGLEIGQKLNIPDVAAKKPTATKLTTQVKTVEAIIGESYTVVNGDSLWKIAVRTYGDGYKWTAIAKANKLVNPSIIHAGNMLTLPR